MTRSLSAQDKVLSGLFGGLLLAQLLLIAVSAAGAPRALDLAHDSNVPSYFNSVLLLGIAGTCGALFLFGTKRRSLALRPVLLPRFWLWVGLAFLYFSLDEAAMIHERVANGLFKKVGLWDDILAGDVTYALWEVLFTPLFGITCLLILILLFRDRSRYSPSFWVGLVAIGSWGVALLVEFVGLTFSWQEQDRLMSLGRIEEGAEILGSTLFLLAVLLVLRGTLGWGRQSTPASAYASPLPSA